MKKDVIMKRMILGLMTAAVLCGCASYNADGTKMTKAQRQAMTAQLVTSMLDNHRYRIEVNTMIPHAYPSRPLTSLYTLEVHGDSLYSYLPYMGRAYHVPYGGGSALNFSAPIDQYDDYLVKKGQRHIDIYVQNDEDRYLYMLDIFTNGSASINVKSYNRDPIDFTGAIDEYFK